MLLILIVVGLVVFVSLLWFVHPRFSPVPFFPTQNQDLNLIIEKLNLRSGDTLGDLGTGEGVIIFKAAKIKGVTCVGVEINPILYLFMWLKRIFHPHRRQIELRRDDFLTTDLTKITHLYLYLSKPYLNKVMKRVVTNPKLNVYRIISYMYHPQMNILKNQYSMKKCKGKNFVFVLTKR